jgi:hypothetical protein
LRTLVSAGLRRGTERLTVCTTPAVSYLVSSVRPCWWRPLWATLGTYGRRLLFAVLVGAVDDYRLVPRRAAECRRA